MESLHCFSLCVRSMPNARMKCLQRRRGKQTENKQKTNRKQTENKQKTNRKQTENKQKTRPGHRLGTQVKSQLNPTVRLVLDFSRTLCTANLTELKKLVVRKKQSVGFFCVC